MIAVIQRVSRASVVVAGEVVGAIERGILALVAVHKTDAADDIEWMARKLVELRIFPNEDRSFDLDLTQIGGGILLVSNFTVAAETRKGRRPSLDAAAGPEQGKKLFDELIAKVRAGDVLVETGRFGADMQVALINDGPVTFIADSRAKTTAVS